MNSDQRANVTQRIYAVNESISGAWDYLSVLKGLQAGAKANPESALEFAPAIAVIYRGVFDALYAVVGTICDRGSNVHSIPNLITMALRYKPEPEATVVLTRSRLALSDPDQAPLTKFKRWRDNYVAHRSEMGRSKDFYDENKLHLTDAEEALSLLERVLNDVAGALINTNYELHSASEPTRHSCESLLALIRTK